MTASLLERRPGADEARLEERRIAARPGMLVLLIALPLVCLGYGLAGWMRGWALGVDSSVYRAGAVLLLHGHSPYAASDLGYLRLSFTYPPAAALLFAPLAALPAQLAWAVMAAASALALALVIRVVVVLSSWLQATWRGAGPRRAARWQRWASAGAVTAVIAVFASTYSVPISQQRHRTLGSFWFFVLSNPYVLTTIAIALVLGAAVNTGRAARLWSRTARDC